MGKLIKVSKADVPILGVGFILFLVMIYIGASLEFGIKNSFGWVLILIGGIGLMGLVPMYERSLTNRAKRR